MLQAGHGHTEQTCVGTLQQLMQTDAQADDSRNRHLDSINWKALWEYSSEQNGLLGRTATEG